MARSDAKLKRQYLAYNRLHFGGCLPRDAEVRWSWSLDGDLGQCIGKEILLSARFRNYGAIWKLALLHEMVHLKVEPYGHGNEFQREMLRLAKRGAFNGLW